MVTGATGFIGSHLVEALVKRKVKVRCLLRKRSDPRWLEGLPIEKVYGDFDEPSSLKEAVKDVDRVFHLAGVTKAVKEETYFRVNAQGTDRLIHACLEENPNLQRFVLVSSQAASGPSQGGGNKTETDPCCPVSPYGRSKRMGEELAMAHRQEIPIVVLRPSAVYGPRDTDMYALFKVVSKGFIPTFWGMNGYFSLCYVEDVVEAILLSAEAAHASGEIFFVSDGCRYRMEEVGETLARAMGVRGVRVPVPKAAFWGVASASEAFSRLSGKPALINRGKAQEMLQCDWGCDISKARNLLGFVPRFDLFEGAKRTYAWYRQEKWL